MSDREVVLVVIGAGASFDAAEVPDGFRMPLTQDLVGEEDDIVSLLGKIQDCQPVVATLRRQLKSKTGAPSLEEALLDYEKRRSKNPEIGRRISGFRFFIRDLIASRADRLNEKTGGVTLYQELVDKLHNWAQLTNSHVCFVSFNYDTLLERAARSCFRFDVADLGDYINRQEVSILKPHGSVGWWHARKAPHNGTTDIETLSRLPDDEFETKPTATNQIEALIAPVAKIANTKAIGIPAVALPISEKDELIWPNDQQQYFESLKGRITKVLTIGWRAAEPDFVETLKSLFARSPKAIFITGEASGGREVQVKLNLGTARRFPGNSVYGFQRFMRDERQIEWLLI